MCLHIFVCCIKMLSDCQVNLVASGASESEIFIWDLNSPDKPMTPGAKAQVCTTSLYAAVC